MGGAIPVCSWTGVTCLPAGNTNIYSITLANLSLQGVIQLEVDWHALRTAASFALMTKSNLFLENAGTLDPGWFGLQALQGLVSLDLTGNQVQAWFAPSASRLLQL